MKSYDIFDTLVGRWYLGIDSVFKEMEKLSMLPGFCGIRKQAEIEAKEKTLSGIYSEVQKLLGINDFLRDFLKEYEFRLEKKRLFPIYENIKKVTREDILVSDTFYTEEELAELLDFVGLPREAYKKIVCSYDGKATGKIWSGLNSEFHTGDNYNSDFVQPMRFGIPSEITSISKEYDKDRIEYTLKVDFGLENLSLFSRALRLQNPYSEDLEDVWNEQATVNIPLLVLISFYLHNKFGNAPLLFTQRDCYHLHGIYSSLFYTKSCQFDTSRYLYTNPTKSFVEYVKNKINKDSIVIDLQGTGKTFHDFFRKNFDFIPKYFPVVYSDLDNTYSVDYIVHRRDGYSDTIEKLNYTDAGKLLDVKYDNPIRETIVFNHYLDVIKDANSLAKTMVSNGFELTPNSNIKEAIEFLLKYAENNCIISKLVNHEEV